MIIATPLPLTKFNVCSCSLSCLFSINVCCLKWTPPQTLQSKLLLSHFSPSKLIGALYSEPFWFVPDKSLLKLQTLLHLHWWLYLPIVPSELLDKQISGSLICCTWTKYTLTWLRSRELSPPQKLLKVCQCDRTKIWHKFRKLNTLIFRSKEICYQGFLILER